MGLQQHAGMTLASADLLPRRSTCVVCGSSDLVRRLRVHAAPEVWFRRCRRCGVVSADRMPTEEVLTRYYRDYYSSSLLGKRERCVTVDTVHRLARHIVDCATPPGPARMSVLDFGGGDGAVGLAVADELERRGAAEVVVTVVDLGDVPAADSRVTSRTSLTGEDLASHDLVIASAVIEHVPDPAHTLRQLLESLAPRGALYARTPFHEAMAMTARRLGRELDLGFPAHLHDMGCDFWERLPDTLALADGFTVTHSRPSVVASSWSSRFARTLSAHALKAPWWVLGNRWRFVGGWEVVVERRT